MNSQGSFKPGDLVTLVGEDRAGLAGIVSEPVTADSPGHVLVLREGAIVGVPASIRDVVAAGESTEGFAQLAYNLIQLGSRVIEARLLV